MADKREHGNKVEATAAEWIIRLGGAPLTMDEREELDAWLGASPCHRAAFDHARSTWAQLDLLKAYPGPLRADMTPAHAMSSPSVIPAARPGRWGRIGMVTAGALAAFGFSSFWFGDPIMMLRADHRTGIGEIRTIALDDGSRIDLGPATAIAVHFDRRERRVELLSGVASFAPTPRASAGGRPFVVEAANGESRALGTRFIVDRLPDSVRVAVAEHDVDVSAQAVNGKTVHAVLSPGRQIRYEASGLSPIASVDVGQAEAWRRGRLLFDAAPLGDVVAELNRYRHGRIIVADARLARRRVSAVFNGRDVNSAIVTIAGELGASIMNIGPFVTIIR
ncbi:MAG: FecR domain-containing protein [Sphingobium sp.]